MPASVITINKELFTKEVFISMFLSVWVLVFFWPVED